RNLAGHVRPHRGGEVSLLVPGQKVPGECHCQHQSKERAARHPKDFTPTLVGTIKKSLSQVQKENNDHRARAIGMEATQERSAGYLLDDVSYGRVGVTSRWSVVKTEKNAGHCLGNEKEEQDRPEDIGPTGAAGNWFVQRVVHERVQSR